MLLPRFSSPLKSLRLTGNGWKCFHGLSPFTILPLLAVIVSITASGCQKSSPTTEQSETGPEVIAVNYPLASITEILAGEFVEVELPVPPEVDPAFWTPNDITIADMQSTDLLLLNGAGHEPWLQQITLSPLNQTQTSLGFRDQWITIENAVTHQHGPEGEHSHAGTAHTTWLDPVLFQEQARVVALALQKLLPEQRDTIEQNLKTVQEQLQNLDQQWRTASEAWQDQPLLASHPVYQYLAQRYGWNLQSLHWEPGEAPSEQDWQKFDQLREKHPAQLMLWEADPLPEVHQKLAERNIQIAVIKPLGNGAPKVSVLEQMQQNADRFAAVKPEN